jgi:hypothetical protein
MGAVGYIDGPDLRNWCAERHDSCAAGQLVSTRKYAIATTGRPAQNRETIWTESERKDSEPLRHSHRGWREVYRALKQRRPLMSDVWYSKQVAKMEIT